MDSYPKGELNGAKFMLGQLGGCLQFCGTHRSPGFETPTQLRLGWDTYRLRTGPLRPPKSVELTAHQPRCCLSEVDQRVALGIAMSLRPV
jgi:hypothetical protein